MRQWTCDGVYAMVDGIDVPMRGIDATVGNFVVHFQLTVGNFIVPFQLANRTCMHFS